MSPLLKLCRCGNPTTTGKCPRCKPTPSSQHKNHRPEWRSVYNTEKWRSIRRLVLIRDAHTCQRCGARATHAAHIQPFATRGTIDYTLAYDMANIQAECARCNGREAATRQAGARHS